MHAQISGTVDFREPDDESCLKRIRALVDKIGAPQILRFSVTTGCRARSVPPSEIYGIFSGDPAQQYDMREMIARIVDAQRV